jgi:hypothetical protein
MLDDETWDLVTASRRYNAVAPNKGDEYATRWPDTSLPRESGAPRSVFLMPSER